MRSRAQIVWATALLLWLLPPCLATARSGPEGNDRPEPVTAAQDPACRPWPGEASPLPTMADPDPVLADWAELRHGELSRVASALELIDPVEAHRFWRHVRCLAPDDPDAREGVARTRPRSVHRLTGLRGERTTLRVAASAPTPLSASARAEVEPEPVAPPAAPDARPNGMQAESRTAARTALEIRPEPPAGPLTPTVPTTEVAAALPGPSHAGTGEPPNRAASTGAGEEVSSERVEAPAAERECGTRSTPCLALARVDDRLGRIEAFIREARFDRALAERMEAEPELARLDGSEACLSRRIRAEILSATAEIALGQEADARASFARVLRVDPGFRLDPNRTAPKVRRVFDAARSGRGPE